VANPFSQKTLYSGIWLQDGVNPDLPNRLHPRDGRSTVVKRRVCAPE
jgi:hypothetical protein